MCRCTSSTTTIHGIHVNSCNYHYTISINGAYRELSISGNPELDSLGYGNFTTRLAPDMKSHDSTRSGYESGIFGYDPDMKIQTESDP